jgi:protocatechuate 3,4-dioxygenase beta subunit
MASNNLISSRRRFLSRVGIGAAALSTARLYERGAFAEELARARTAPVEEGPFYPTKFPLDTDNDLLIVNNAITPAVGDVTGLGGRLLDEKGGPIRNAEIEIWQVDHMAVYLRDRPNQSAFDVNFQGFGRFLTGSTGDYYFRTIKPVRYPGRMAPHIHFKIKIKGRPDWNTQMFVKGDPGNLQDGIYRGIDPLARDTVTMDFAPLKNSRIGELAVKFDIVLGYTQTD